MGNWRFQKNVNNFILQLINERHRIIIIIIIVIIIIITIG